VSFVRACAVGDLTAGKPHPVTVEGVDVALVKEGEDVFAIHDECSHAAIPLSEGDVEGCLIECWLHGSTFDLRTGEPTTLPAFQPVPVYPVQVEGEDVLVDIENPINGVPTP
jgi:3-phenylpropionate/trans-cinnamate dioxygenase ferredoxin component